MSGRYPNFFIFGAPKCGTTTLAKWLADHPEIFMCVPKEPHFFNTDMCNRGISSDSQYKNLFANTKAQQVAVGEASTWYLYSSDAVRNIEQLSDSPKYIVMVRDPIAMVQSLYHHNLRHLHEDAPTFEQAWRLQQERSLGKNIPTACADANFLQYKKACLLGEQVSRLLNFVPTSRVLIIDLRDLNKNPQGQYRRVLDFLGVADDGRDDFSRENEAREARNIFLQRFLMFGGRVRRAFGIRKGFGLLKLNERKISKVALSESLLDELRSEFAEDRKKLKEIIEDQ